jgi:transcriptional regulator with GAF, ATPase, and Fis domain
MGTTFAIIYSVKPSLCCVTRNRRRDPPTSETNATEREHILRALRESHGQIGGLKGAAARLGLKQTTLQSKLKHFGINPRSGFPAQ